MDARENAVESRRALDDWSVYRMIFPRFYEALEPFGTLAPQILNVPAVRTALCALLLVNIDAFRSTASPVASLEWSRIFRQWHNAHYFWNRRRRVAYRYLGTEIVPSAADPKRPEVVERSYGLWPVLLVGLKTLDPTLPKIPENGFLNPELQERLRRHPKCWPYLSLVARLLDILGRAKNPKR